MILGVSVSQEKSCSGARFVSIGEAVLALGVRGGGQIYALS